MKSLIATLALTLVGIAAHAGGGSFPTCNDQSLLSCQTQDGSTLFTISQVYCQSDDYGDYVEGNSIQVNSPSGLIDGRIKFASDRKAWKLSSKEKGSSYSIGRVRYNIELYIDASKRGPLAIVNAKTGRVIVDGTVICR